MNLEAEKTAILLYQNIIPEYYTRGIIWNSSDELVGWNSNDGVKTVEESNMIENSVDLANKA